MDNIFNLDHISELIEKLELGVISYLEHDYLQKSISASMLIQQYNKTRNEQNEFILFKYYNWLVQNANSQALSPKMRTEYFLLKIEIEKFFHFFEIKIQNKLPIRLTQFEQLQTIAQLWGHALQRQESKVLKFLAFFIQEIYEVPPHYIEEVFSLLRSSWKPTLSPIAAIPHKKFSLEEIEEYFFGRGDKQAFEPHVLLHADRLFSITNPQFKNHLFLPKRDNFDLFEAALVVHEFQHIQDSPKFPQESLFLSEKNALNAERVFLNVTGTGKRGKFCWLESNLFYPLLLLKWELDIILSDAYNIDNFYEICNNHGMEPLCLSPLFDWRAPFQMSAYCAASMDLEPNWKNYLREFGDN